MPVNYIPTLQPTQPQMQPAQHPLAPSNMANIANALKGPQDDGSGFPNMKPGASNTMFSGLFGPSTGSITQPNALMPYGINWNGMPTGTDPTLNTLGD